MNKLASYLQKRFHSYGDSIAIKYKDSTLCYNQLDIISSELSNLLKDKKISSNIAIYGKKDIFKYISVVSIIYANKTYVPLNEKNIVSKNSTIIKNSDINTIITTKDSVEFIKKSFTNISNIITIDDKFDFQHIKLNLQSKDYSYSDLGYILFTSGSTGEPKGVKVSKDNILAYIKTKLDIYKFSQGLNFSQTAQLSFDISTFETFISLSSGGILHLISDEDILCPSDYIMENNINVWYSVPTFAINMDKLGVYEENCFPSLKYSFFCGEPMPKDIAIKWLSSATNSILDNLYGPTEATVDVTRYSFTQDNFHQKFYNDILPIGKPIDNQDVIIVDNDNNIITKINEVGEILISGTQLSQGYLNNEIKNQEHFIEYSYNDKIKRFYRTGDLAFYNDNMDLEFHSRKDTQIKIGGKRVEIGEIEYIFKSNNLLKNIIIVPKKDTNGRVMELVAFIVENLDQDGIKVVQKKAMGLLDRLFIPKKFIYIEDYPKTISNKIDRKFLENSI